MKVGDLVKFKIHDNRGLGIVIEGSMSQIGRFQRTRVYWLKTGKYGSYFPNDLEGINEKR